jgi:glycosyltransferase involved in cell wall biosynthesis
MAGGRVLMTADAVGGVWQYALELGGGLRAAGMEVVLAVLGPGPSDGQRAAAMRQGLELVASPLRLEWQDDPWDDVAAAGEWLQALERRRGCDLVHLNGYTHGALPFRGPKLVVAHSCVLSWWRAVKRQAAPAALDRYRRQVEAGLAGADRVVAPSRAMRAALRECYGAGAPVTVIHNGRDGRVFAAGEKEPFALCAGRLWDEAKNMTALARVAPHLPWPVRLAGDAAGPAGATAAPRGVTLLGPLSPEALARQYARAAIYVSPARYEPFGLCVLEAALAGCALVLSDIPSLRELWHDAALFAPPDDDGALAAALTSLMTDAPLRATLARRAQRRARRYSSERMVRRYLDLYRALARSREVRPCAS